MSDERAAAGSPSVVSVFHILDRLAEAGHPLSMADIARDVGLPKSSAARILGSLESQQVVQRDATTRQYSIGSKLRNYASASPETDLVAEFQKIAGPAARALDETMQFGVLTGSNVTFLSVLNSTQPVRLVSFAGRTLPAHATATGKAILAFSEADAVEGVIADGLARVAANTITDPQVFRDELAGIRDRGYATESEESTANLSCVAAPVIREGSGVVAAVTACVPQASIPAARMELLTRAVLEASYRLSAV